MYHLRGLTSPRVSCSQRSEPPLDEHAPLLGRNLLGPSERCTHVVRRPRPRLDLGKVGEHAGSQFDGVGALELRKPSSHRATPGSTVTRGGESSPDDLQARHLGVNICPRRPRQLRVVRASVHVPAPTT